ncbi:hypothetical protein MKJ04_20380 [Pontibacter sp. E15-1]|uniref:hypothetical protein n=1 Tax=Pontibacter sp. E15-1 TaxID=2919918 RepID=UPI001F5022D1|nr:hypothetical protein [Pontibacter sp. E15-1]MCJ8167209.1 hypothetical protein [Pontibacter sp. E15-1]
MKKLFSVFLLAAALLIGIAPVANAQTRGSLTADEANALLHHTLGAWQIDALTWQPWQHKFASVKGKASFSRVDEGGVREQLSVRQPDGSVEKMEGILRYSAQNKRFEYMQLDRKGNTTQILFGHWNPNFSMILFEPARGRKQAARQVLWQYFFFDDGSFKKVIRTPDGNGNHIIAAEFHCQQPKVADVKR